MQGQEQNGEVTFKYLKETRNIRCLLILVLGIAIIEFNPIILALETKTSPFDLQDFFLFDVLYVVIVFAIIYAVISMTKQKQYIITVSKDKIIVNGRIIDISEIKYMGYVGCFRSSYYAIITNNSEEIVIELSKKCDDYLYQVCKANNIQTDTRKSESERNDTLWTILGILLPFILLIIILLIFKLLVPNLNSTIQS